MIVIWIAAIVVFGIVEAVTVGLVSIWFVLGAVAGLLAAVLGGGPVGADRPVLRGEHCGAGGDPSAGAEDAPQGRDAHQRRPGAAYCPA